MDASVFSIDDAEDSITPFAGPPCVKENTLNQLEQGSIISLSSVWQNSILSSCVQKITLADAKYDKFYLPASLSKNRKIQEKLDRDLKRAEVLTHAEAGSVFKSKRLVAALQLAVKSPRSRLEMYVQFKKISIHIHNE